MWCRSCKQDVPGIASAEHGKLRCLRCQSPLADGPAEPTASASDVGVEPMRARTLPYDAWEAEEKLRHIGRLLRSGSAKPKVERHAPNRFRTDGPHGQPRAWHAPTAAKREKAQPHEEIGTEAGGTFLVWTAVSLGVMALVCGGILMIWSVLGVRPELWNVGLPIAVLGQIALVLGLILQLDRLWHHHRRTAAKLDNVDGQLHRLRTRAARLQTTPAGVPTGFHSLRDEEASPQVLLTDLKSQLERLTVRLGQMNGDR
jgi:hypothetical protein